MLFLVADQRAMSSQSRDFKSSSCSKSPDCRVALIEVTVLEHKFMKALPKQGRGKKYPMKVIFPLSSELYFGSVMYSGCDNTFEA